MRKEKFNEVFMRRKLTFGEVLLDSQADDEGQPRDRVTMHATARTMDSSRVGTVEISYAEVRAMIDIPTKERTHGENPADEDKMPDLPRDHVRDTAYRDRRPLTADRQPPTADR